MAQLPNLTQPASGLLARRANARTLAPLSISLPASVVSTSQADQFIPTTPLTPEAQNFQDLFVSSVEQRKADSAIQALSYNNTHPNRPDSKGRTALDVLATSTIIGADKVYSLLITHGLKPYLKDRNNGLTAIDKAIQLAHNNQNDAMAAFLSQKKQQKTSI